ncbi:hypothetical protein [Parendozoicomonas sp. Alg238-R29]|uniref:hypothetical protein n=1 Tax=Parendozoicomonas sp. Alg238-R29 TaxID=2993446 RepID=UPI00248F0299|nr:hypothetical protein [Parendozoicomonas sp. Alg238-R29]
MSSKTKKFVIRQLAVALLFLGWAQLGYTAPECETVNFLGFRGEYCHEIKELEDIVIRPSESDLQDNAGGSLIVNESYCHTSTRNGSAWDFHVNFQSGSGAVDLGNGNYRLSSSTGSSLPVNVQWRGSSNSGFEAFDAGTTSSSIPGAVSCANSGAQIRVAVARSALRNAKPGTYNATLRMQPEVDTYFSSRTFTPVNFAIMLPELTKISRLDDMSVTQRNADDDGYAQDERFCVFVWGGGDYNISASGGVGTNDPFLLRNGSQSLAYDVQLSTRANGNRLQPVSPGQALTASGGSSLLSCGNSDNARARVEISDSVTAGKPAGTYSGTLYLTVEPA